MKKGMKQRILSLLLVLVMAVGMLPTWARAADAPSPAQDPEHLFALPEEGVSVVLAAPAIITSADDLATLAEAVNSGDSCVGQTITLAADITLNGEWMPIGTSASPFSGTFDGQGHTISGLSIVKNEKDKYSYQGLFGSNAGTVQNLTVNGTLSINTSEMNAYSGGIVGYNTGTINECANDVEVTVTGSWSGYYVGGIAGYNGGTINSCVNRGAVTGTTAVGGIAGQQSGSSTAVNNCYNTATITNTGNHTGGIIGLQSSGDVANCYNVGSISGTSNANSVIGSKRGNAPKNCFFLEGGSDSNAAAKTSDELKALASTLGEAFAEDSGNINNGYPVLAWQNEEKEVSPDLVIATVEQFKAFAEAVNGGDTYEGEFIALAANLDLGGKEWTPIGTSSNRFKGTFDGQYHTISGLSIHATAANVGLFGYLDSMATVKNVAVSGTIVTSSNAAAGIVGYSNSGTVENCLNAVDVDGSSGNMTNYFGGIVGQNYKGTITGCANTGTIKGVGATGGITGQHASGVMENCYDLGNVSASSTYMSGFAGGITGQMRNMGSPTATMTNCYSVGSVLDGKAIGAVIGSYSAGTVENCYYLSGVCTDSNATAKTSDEMKALAGTLGSAFEANTNGYPSLAWEKNIDTSAPLGPVFPEASAVSATLSGYIRAAINAKKTQAGLSEDQSLLSTYTISDTATDWIAVTMGRYGYQDGSSYTFLYDDGSGYINYISALQAYVTEKYFENGGLLHDKKATEWQRLILAVNAIGGDPTSFGTYNGDSVDLVNDGTYNHADPGWQGINGSIFGLIALDSKNYSVPADAVTTREKFIKDILALQLTDGASGNEMGGWALSGTSSDPDITAMAIQALAPYYNSETTYTYTNSTLKKEMTQSVRQAVNAALDKLGALQLSDGDYASWGTVNAESTAQVLVSLCSLGIDPATDARFTKNGKSLLDGILKYRLKGGGFSHSYDADPEDPSSDPGAFNGMATDQASYALVAYWRFENGMRALYDMRPEWTSSDRAAIDAAIAAIDSVPAPGSGNYKADLKTALTAFEQVPESERRYVSNYNDLAAAIEIVGGKEALDTDDKYPISMAITAPPAKTIYTEGETFDPAGMVVTLTYSDGSTEAVTGYTLQPTGELTVSVTEIAVSYNAFTVTQKIAVNEQAPWEGAGTEGDPYLIQDLTDLRALKDWVDPRNKNTQGIYFKMTANIDMSSVSDWSPIGLNRAFQGVFDGDGHYLTNYNNASAWYTGVFGTVSGTIRNFGVANGTIVQYSNASDQGVIVNVLSSGKVLNCWSGADVTFTGGYSGAIVGAIRSGKDNLIEGCYNLGNVSGPEAGGALGGIIGYSDSGSSTGSGFTLTIRDCYNRGNISSVSNVGGILGHSRDGVLMSGCYNTGNVTSTASRVGGLLGVDNHAEVINCFYLEGNVVAEGGATVTQQGVTKTAEEMKSTDFLTTLDAGNDAYKSDRVEDPINDGYPVLAWQGFPPRTITLTFSVTPEGAQIVVQDAQGTVIAANDDGTYTLIPGETYSYTASAQGYVEAIGSIAAIQDRTVTVTLQRSGSTVTPSDPLKEHREKALANLKKQYDKFNREDYPTENWAILEAAYEKGVADIKAAGSSGGSYPENNIIKALNTAIAAMQAVEPSRTVKITVAVSVDANTLGLGYLVKPTLVEVDRYTKCSAVLTDLLRENGYEWEMTGNSVESGFYLAGIEPVDQTKANVAPFIVNAVGGESKIMYSDRNDTKLGEFDYYNMSGWMYSVDGSFPGVGAAGWSMTQGEVMRWQFTVYGYGADLNADNSAWGSASIIPTLGNKDQLTWLVASLRNEYSDTRLEADKVYLEAIKILTSPDATQAKVDAAEEALRAADFSKAEPSGENAPAGPGTSVSVGSTTEVKDGTATVAVTKAQMEKALKDAGEDNIMTITVDTGDKEVSSVSVTAPIESLIKAGKSAADVNIESIIGSVTLPAGSLAALPEDPGGVLSVGITNDTETSTVTVSAAINDKPAEDLPFRFEFPISESAGTSAPSDQKDEAGLVVVIVDADGNETVVKKSMVTSGTASVLLSSGAEVTVRSNAKTFSDVADGAWYSECVAYASGHELFSGTSDTTFAPSAPMSRAMLATVLCRLEDAKATGRSPFPDVPDGTWYTDAVTWANDVGIVNGTGSGFAPNGNVTREQLVTMLYRYAKVLGMDTAATGDLTKFADSSKTSDWAKEAMQWAIGNGLIFGKGNGTLDPTGSATRAEAAAILQRLIGLTVK